MACGLGAKVYLLDMNLDRLRYLSDVMPSNCFLLMSSPGRDSGTDHQGGCGGRGGADSRRQGAEADNPGDAEDHEKGAVLVDVAIDQGGCFETSKPTTHTDPIYIIDDVIHYCVANMPGAVPKTSTLALTNATLPYALEIANKGWKKAMQDNPEIRLGANVVQGHVTYSGVAEAFGLPLVDIATLI